MQISHKRSDSVQFVSEVKEATLETDLRQHLLDVRNYIAQGYAVEHEDIRHTVTGNGFVLYIEIAFTKSLETTSKGHSEETKIVALPTPNISPIVPLEPPTITVVTPVAPSVTTVGEPAVKPSVTVSTGANGQMVITGPGPAGAPLSIPVQPTTAPVLSPVTDGKVTGMIMNGANVRIDPEVGVKSPVTQLKYGETARLLNVRQGNSGDSFKWFQIDVRGITGWVREDLVRLTLSRDMFGLAADLYISPAPQSQWIRDYDETGAILGAIHYGWDHAAINGQKGAAIIASINGGYVLKVDTCDACGQNGDSFSDKNISIGDNRYLNGNQGIPWNYGYGHNLIVRYNNDILPETTRRWLETRGWRGYHAFVMYAHLQKFHVSEGTATIKGQRIADMGNSGNSTGPHLHLELRFGATLNSEWNKIRDGLVTPGRLFFR